MSAGNRSICSLYFVLGALCFEDIFTPKEWNVYRSRTIETWALL
jgi:hypothetical protein